jgi:hypothetical protein
VARPAEPRAATRLRVKVVPGANAAVEALVAAAQPREANQKSVRTGRVDPGLVVDFADDGRAIGIEITAPAKLSLAGLNAALRELGQPPATAADLAPVLAA